jgi:Xaa-Pro aminopeptidase
VVRLGVPLVDRWRRSFRRLRLKRWVSAGASLSVANHRAYRKAVHPAALVALPAVVDDLRETKDSSEVAAIERAIEVA